MSVITSPTTRTARPARTAHAHEAAFATWRSALRRSMAHTHASSTPRRHIAASLAVSLVCHGVAFAGLSWAVATHGAHRWFAVEPGRASVALRASTADMASSGDDALREESRVEIEPLTPAQHEPAPAPTALRDDDVTPEPRQDTRLALVARSAVNVPSMLQAKDGSATEPQARPARKGQASVRPDAADETDEALPRPKKTNVGMRRLEQLTAGKVDSQASPASVASRGADTDIPAIVHNPAPDYPADALQSRLSGRVVLDVGVAADGSVAWAKIHTSSGSPSLDRAALDAIHRWRFTPADSSGAGVRDIRVPIRFMIENT